MPLTWTNLRISFRCCSPTEGWQMSGLTSFLQLLLYGHHLSKPCTWYSGTRCEKRRRKLVNVAANCTRFLEKSSWNFPNPNMEVSIDRGRENDVTGVEFLRIVGNSKQNTHPQAPSSSDSFGWESLADSFCDFITLWGDSFLKPTLLSLLEVVVACLEEASLFVVNGVDRTCNVLLTGSKDTAFRKANHRPSWICIWRHWMYRGRVYTKQFTKPCNGKKNHTKNWIAK